MTRLRSLPATFFLLTGALGFGVDSENEPELSFEGEGLEVVGTAEVNQQVRVVTRAQIEQTEAADVAGLLESALGVAVTRSGAYGAVSSVSLRGLGSGRVAILIDGVPVNSAQSGSFDLSSIPVSAVEKIEVIPGGADTKYNVSGAAGGVINLITVKNPEPGLSVRGSAANRMAYPGSTGTSFGDGQEGTLGFSLADEETFWNLDLAAHRSANEFEFLDEDGKARRWTGNGVIDAGVAASVGWNFPAGRRLLLSANGYWGDKDVSGSISSSSGGQQHEFSSRSSLLWSVPEAGTEALTATLGLNHRFSRLVWTDAGGTSIHSLNTLGFVGSGDWEAGVLVVQGGADADLSWLDSTELGRENDASGGLWITLLLSPLPSLQGVASVKGVWARDLAMPIPVPKAGWVFRSPALMLKNNYFRVFKLPTLNDRYWPADSFAKGNPHLKPEEGWGTDLVASGPLGSGTLALGTWETAWYATEYFDAISWQPAGGIWTPRNIGRAAYLGSDSTVTFPLGESWALSGTYSWLITWILTDGLTFADQRRMPYQPLHKAGLTVTHVGNTDSFSVTGHFESERYLTTLNVFSLPPFLTVDATWKQSLGGGWEFYLAAKNLFNQSYSSVEGYPMPGGSVTTGVRWR